VKKGLEHLCQVLLERSKAKFIPGQKTDIREDPHHHLCSTIVPSHIPSKSLSVVNIAYQKKLSIPYGFGYLVPSLEQEKIKGVVFDSIVFPEQNRHEEETRLTVIMDLQEYPEEIAIDALRRHLHITCDPDFVYMTEYQNAIVQPPLFHLDKMAKEFPPSEHITWLGTHLHGASLSDCVSASKRAAARL